MGLPNRLSGLRKRSEVRQRIRGGAKRIFVLSRRRRMPLVEIFVVNCRDVILLMDEKPSHLIVRGAPESNTRDLGSSPPWVHHWPRRHRHRDGGESPSDYGVWGSVVSFPSGVRSSARAENNFRAFLSVLESLC